MTNVRGSIAAHRGKPSPLGVALDMRTANSPVQGGDGATNAMKPLRRRNAQGQDIERSDLPMRSNLTRQPKRIANARLIATAPELLGEFIAEHELREQDAGHDRNAC